MMSKIDQYVQAATRDNTRKAYQAAVQHFEVEWGGFLPATADSIARYLADYAEALAANTLKQRLAGLAQWHLDQGFPDPTKTPLVKKVLKGIRELHPAQEKQAKPLQIEQLRQLIQWIDTRLAEPMPPPVRLRLLRDRALVLLGFWRGFRSDELCRIAVEHLTLVPGQGLTLYIPRSKGDRQAQGRTVQAPALQALCPVEACQAWLDASGLTAGPLFPAIDRWGNLSVDALNVGSIIPLLRDLFARAQVPESDRYSSHSLRRGFASWANAAGWDTKALMEYVGWRDVKSALRYIDSRDPFGELRNETITPRTVTALMQTEPK